MTGPEGEKAPGWWRLLEVDPPHHLSFENGVADETGEPMADMPFMIMQVVLRETLRREPAWSIEGTFPSDRGHGPVPLHGHGRGHYRLSVTDRRSALNIGLSAQQVCR